MCYGTPISQLQFDATLKDAIRHGIRWYWGRVAVVLLTLMGNGTKKGISFRSGNKRRFRSASESGINAAD